MEINAINTGTACSSVTEKHSHVPEVPDVLARPAPRAPLARGQGQRLLTIAMTPRALMFG
jgi:hypothetical protein